MNINKNIDKLLSTGVFCLSLIVYSITMSRTVNFWESGELIACANGLEIGSPMGSPLYLIIGRIFALFSSSAQNIAVCINLLSALSCAFAVLLSYKSIYIICTSSLSSPKLANIISEKDKIKLTYISSYIGAMSLAFSSSFWTCALSANTHSLSTFFISLSTFVMLKHTNDTRRNTDYLLVLCSLLVGLSLCINFQNILIIPCLALIYKLGKANFSIKYLLKSTGIIIFYFIILYWLIKGLPIIASKFELLFVNDFGLRYNSGLIIFFILLFSLLTGFIFISGKKLKRRMNLSLTCTFVFFIGLLPYLLLPIRSASNPPIDQNNTENIFNLISYLNGGTSNKNKPLLYGQQYNSSYDTKIPFIKGETIYDTVNGKYKEISRLPQANYKSSERGFFPRMWSSLPEHTQAYKEWTNYKQDKIPPFSKNLEFMLRYQISHQYLRFILRNFVGQQNDLLSHGGSLNGNWISGIRFIDSIRLHKTKKLPKNLRENNGRTVFFFLPLLLGIIGTISLYRYEKKYFYSLISIFVFMGIALCFFLNLTPDQAREQDYLFLSSYYAFSMLIGLGFIGVYLFSKRHLQKIKHPIILSSLICISASPLQFITKNFSGHNLKSNVLARSFAYNMLNSCKKDAILFTSGDNETYPLWYMQEVEKIRTDVRIININFLKSDWYIDQITCRQRESEGINLSIDKSKYKTGQRDILLVRENPNAFIEGVYISNIKEINEDYSVIYNRFLNILIKSNFNKTHKDEFEYFSNTFKQISPIKTNQHFKDICSGIYSLETKDERENYGIDTEDANELIDLLNKFLIKQASYPIPLNQALNFVYSDDPSTKFENKLYDYPIDYFPAKRLFLPINKAYVKEKFSDYNFEDNEIIDNMLWGINKESITKSELIILEIICNNMWQRPIYFSSLSNKKNFIGLEEYLFLEGLTYRLLPIKSVNSKQDFSENSLALSMYNNITNIFDWGDLGKKDCYYDENCRNILTNIRTHYTKLAKGLFYIGEIEKSEKILDKCIELIPNDIIPYNNYSLSLIQGYYRINKSEKAREVAVSTIENAMNEVNFYNSFTDFQKYKIKHQKENAEKIIENINLFANKYNDKELLKIIEELNWHKI